ncbi:MAG: hypothetical protein AB7D33_05790 [Sphingobium sp.]
MMAKRDPSLPAAIRSFLSALEPLGVYPDLKASLNLKLDLPDQEKPVNFGYIMKNGTFRPSPLSWTQPEEVWRPHFEELAKMIGGTVVDEPNNKFVAVNGRSTPRIEQLLPRHQEGWVAAIERVVRNLSAEAG